MQLTYRYRVKDKHAARLDAQARAVNFVWNYCNETQRAALRNNLKWPSGPDLMRLTAGATKCGLDLHAHTVQEICRNYERSRRQHRKAWLRWRGRKSLGWVPFNTGHVAFDDGAFIFRSERYEVWYHRPLPDGAKIGRGSFSADARGRWYLNVPVEVESRDKATEGDVGIDLGLKTLATCSDGEVIAMPAYARRMAERIGNAQRARKKRLARTRHARVRNQRRDYLHKASAKIAKRNRLIVVGDASPSKLARTRMAKSVLDAGWSDFRSMLAYKAVRHGGAMLEVPEANTTRTCSACAARGGPKGIAGLEIRGWTCGSCGAVHDRDVNAAQNILALGRESLAGGSHV
jgi:IS605 OrfB family transposase